MATYAAFKHVELFNVGNAKKRVLKPPGGGSSDLFGTDAQPQTPRSMNKNRMQSNIFAAPEAQKAGNVFRQGVHRYYFLGETPRRGASGQDSHNRLFGEADRPYTPAKNHMKSNLPIGSDATDSGKANGHSNGKATNGHHLNGNGTAPATNGHSSSNGSSHINGHSNGTISTSSAPSQNGSSHTSPKSSSSSTVSTPRSPRFAHRNPVTGNGVEDYADKPRKPSSRRGENGNPVTGEGYKSGGAAEINTTVPSLNGAGHVINKNRIPPGGFSSGLW
ncbi:microtubule-associated protein Jupiter isoform X2 [Armigeres subalbatus]|uniref:microtubule-associated protein Jupiter isoform X2 n=1 Tax=Armigeres subalbatus TaxID=124917 RepID=UPI002ED4E2C5